MTNKVFTGEKPYEALSAAQKFLLKEGYSFGVEDGKNSIGIKKGDCVVKRWSYMSNKEISELDGIIESKNFRGNKVIISIF